MLPAFDPSALGLRPEFNLTTYADLKGWGCKLPQASLSEYLQCIGDGSIGMESPDCSIVPTINDTFMISTTDYFYPLVTDPYLQGRIAACNVLSDLYAMGVSKCDTMLMILAISLKMTPDEQKIVTTEIVKGFNDTAREAGTSITGG
jgi:selenide,water dikinase